MASGYRLAAWAALVFNFILVVALAMSVIGCGIMIYNRVWIPISNALGG